MGRMNCSEDLIAAINITFAYQPGKQVLNGVNFRLPKGSVAAIVGPNGVGKSTILKILCGYLKPASGEVLLEGRPIQSYDNLERSRLVAAVPQNIYAPIPFTVEQVVKMGRLARISRFARLTNDDKEVIARTMHDLNIAVFAGRAIGELSGGERQRVMIATALAQEPDLLLLDEPTSHLDIGNSARVIKALINWQRKKGSSILIVTHDVQMAARVCERIILLKDGNVLGDGNPHAVLTPESLFQAYGHGVSSFISPKDGLPVILPDLPDAEY
ncbi:MAG: ABC transporter ATP-binding protein [Victivallaceae bacterium]